MAGEIFYDIRERSAEDGTWTERGTGIIRKERITHWGTSQLALFTEYYCCWTKDVWGGREILQASRRQKCMESVIWKIEETWAFGRHRPLCRNNTERSKTDWRGRFWSIWQ